MTVSIYRGKGRDHNIKKQQIEKSPDILSGLFVFRDLGITPVVPHVLVLVLIVVFMIWSFLLSMCVDY